MAPGRTQRNQDSVDQGHDQDGHVIAVLDAFRDVEVFEEIGRHIDESPVYKQSDQDYINIKQSRCQPFSDCHQVLLRI